MLFLLFLLFFYVLHLGLWFILNYRPRFFFILHFVYECLFSIEFPLHFVKTSLCMCALLVVFRCCECPSFISSIYCLDYSSLIVILKIRECESAQLYCFPARPSSFLWSFRSGGRGWTKPQGSDVALQVLWCNPTGPSPYYTACRNDDVLMFSAFIQQRQTSKSLHAL